VGFAISIFGMGYVGSVSAACFAHLGHRVIGVDVNRAKVDMLESGKSPILEARMNELVAEGRAACRLHGTTDSRAAIHESDISFICVGTPSLRSGKLDLSHVEHVSAEIGAALREKKRHHSVVLRSTVLPGTTESVVVQVMEKASGLRAGVDFSVCYNPEFMREGSAVADFFQPPYTILGASAPQHLKPLRQLYENLPGTTFETTIPVAEMVKYVSNTFHALKVTFANEIGTLCKSFGVDTEMVTGIFKSDTKLNISPAYLSPGFAFGGSCLPKDVRAITHRAKEMDLNLPLLEAIVPSNAEHIERAVEMILQTGKKKIGMLGLSFKAATDDLRESPLVGVVKRLLGEGRQIQIWDQNVSVSRLVGSNREYIEETIPHFSALFSTTLEDVIADAEVVVVATREVTGDSLRKSLKPEQIVIDLANLENVRRPGGNASYEGICW